MDLLNARIAQLATPTLERLTAETSTSACQTTAAATANANAPTRMDPSSVAIAQLGMSTTETRAAKT